MHRGKGMKFVGDSRVPATEHRKPNIPKDYSEYPGKTEAFLAKLFIKRMDGWCCFSCRIFMFNRCTSVSIRKNSRSR